MNEMHAAEIRKEYQQTQQSVNALLNQVKSFAEDFKGKTENGEKIAQAAKNSADEAMTKLNELSAREAALSQKIASMELRDGTQTSGAMPFIDQLKNHADFKALNGRFQGSQRIQFTNTLATLPHDAAVVTHGMLFPETAKPLTIRDLLSKGRTKAASISHLVETGFTNAATTAANGGARPYSQITTEARLLPVVAVGHLFKTTRESLDDSEAFASLIEARGIGGMRLAEDYGLLYGDGSAGQMLGLVKNAVKYTKPAAAAGITGIQSLDHIRLAMLQVYSADYPPTGVVLSPLGMAQLETIKNKQESYLIGQPLGTEARTLWGLPVVQTPALKDGHFLVGAFKAGAQLFDRGEFEILLSTENDRDFESAKVTIKAEQRECLAIYRPEAFVYGKLDGTEVTD